MIEDIKKALEEVAHLQLNIESESARNFLAQKIAKAMLTHPLPHTLKKLKEVE